MTAQEHNKMVGIFLMVHGGIQALTMLILAVVYGVMGSLMMANARRDEEQMVGVVFIGMIVMIVFMSVIFVVPQLLGGWKLIKQKSGARTWGIVASIVALLSFPFGTAAGVYGLWFLFGDVGKNFYLSGGGGNQPMNNFQPPSPHGWQ